jgi:methionyl-tRNA formyltransferase
MTAPRVLFAGMNFLFSTRALRALRRHVQLVGIIETVVPRNRSPDPAAFTSPLRSFARRTRIPHFLFTAAGPRPFDFIRACKPDVLVVAAMSQILRLSEISAAPLGAVNLHPSLLPLYRGPEPLFWHFRHMRSDAGVTVHRIDPGIDTGDILLQQSLPISLGESHRSLLRRTALAGGPLLLQAIQQIAANRAAPRPQPADSGLFYARHPAPADRTPDWHNWSLQHTWHFLRGVQDDFRSIPLAPPLQGRWRILTMHHQCTSAPPGTLVPDPKCPHLVHPEGIIRLQHVPPQHFLRRWAGICKRKLLDGA